MPLGPFFFQTTRGGSSGYTPGYGGHEKGHSNRGVGDMGGEITNITQSEYTLDQAPARQWMTLDGDCQKWHIVVAKCHVKPSDAGCNC